MTQISKHDIYGEVNKQPKVTGSTQESTDENNLIISYDLSDGNLTLHKMIETFLQIDKSRSTGVDLLIYFVCGVDYKCVDFPMFLDYIATKPNCNLVFRGVIHADFICKLQQPNLFVMSGSIFKFNLLIFNKFVQFLNKEHILTILNLLMSGDNPNMLKFGRDFELTNPKQFKEFGFNIKFVE